MKKKNMMRFVSLALVIVSLLAVAAPALATDYFREYLGRESFKHGASGIKVHNLQYMLLYAGYFQGNCDAKFGDITDAAVRKFQRAYCSTVDGIVGRETKEMLYLALGGQAPPECGLYTGSN